MTKSVGSSPTTSAKEFISYPENVQLLKDYFMTWVYGIVAYNEGYKSGFLDKNNKK